MVDRFGYSPSFDYHTRKFMCFMYEYNEYEEHDQLRGYIHVSCVHLAIECINFSVALEYERECIMLSFILPCVWGDKMRKWVVR